VLKDALVLISSLITVLSFFIGWSVLAVAMVKSAKWAWVHLIHG